MDKRIRNILFILLFLLGAGASASYAQGGRLPAFRQKAIPQRRPNANKRLEAVKKGYMSQRLNLSKEQKDKFWPIYDQYQNELDEVLILRRQNNKDPQAGADQFDKDLEYQQKITGIQKHYYEEF